MNTWNERLKIARTARGMKKNRLAALVQVSTASTSDWENGVVKNLEAQNLLRICSALEISADWLINGRGKMEIYGHDHANTETGPCIKHRSFHGCRPENGPKYTTILPSATRKNSCSSNADLSKLGYLLESASANEKLDPLARQMLLDLSEGPSRLGASTRTKQ
jgi:DNA-binding Xre family transcriptional regulator